MTDKKVAIYIRCSSDEAKKEGYSPETQEEKSKELIKTNGYKLDKRHVYADLGCSGGTDKRPELQRLLKDAKNGEFDIVIVYRMDRFFRNLRLLLNTVDELRNLGIEFKSITEPFDTSTPTGRAMFGNIGVFAEWMREVGLEARNEGMIKAMKEGKWLAPAPYGYKYNSKTQKLEIYPKETRVVKMIFEWLAYEELSEHKIQERLNLMKIPTKYDNLGKNKKANSKGWWCKRAIGRMLRNEIYTGTFYWRKYISSNRIGLANNLRPETEWIETKTPAIISQELFEKAQKQIEKNKANSPRKTKTKYLFQHKIICGHDGRKWQSACRLKQGTWKEVRYYFCSGIRKETTSKKCPSSSVSESKITPVVWENLVNLLSGPESAIKTLRKYQQQKDKKPEIEKQLKQVLELIKTNKGQQDRLNKAFIYGGIDESRYKTDLEKLKNEENGLFTEKQRLSQLLLSEEEQGTRVESIKELYKRLKRGLEGANYELKRLAMQKLIKSITIKDEDMDIEFRLPTLEFVPQFSLRDRARMD